MPLEFVELEELGLLTVVALEKVKSTLIRSFLILNF
jgi:hypothetical protein